MKKRLLILLALSVAGCRVHTPNDAPIRLLSTFSLDDGKGNTCNFDNTLRQVGGSLDLDVNGGYVLRVDIESELEPVSLKFGDRPASGPDQNDYIYNSLYATYFLGGSPSSDPPYVSGGTQIGNSVRSPLYGVVRAGGTNKQGIQLLTPSVASAVSATLTPLGGSNTLYVNFRFEGYLASGQSLKSTEVTFPILVYRGGGITCNNTLPGPPPIPDRIAPTGPCKSLPQDNELVACCNGPLRDSAAVKAACQ